MICSFCKIKLTKDEELEEVKQVCYHSDNLHRCKKCMSGYQCLECYSLKMDTAGLGYQYDEDGICGYERPEFCSQECAVSNEKAKRELATRKTCERCNIRYICKIFLEQDLCDACREDFAKFMLGELCIENQ